MRRPGKCYPKVLLPVLLIAIFLLPIACGTAATPTPLFVATQQQTALQQESIPSASNAVLTPAQKADLLQRVLAGQTAMISLEFRRTEFKGTEATDITRRNAVDLGLMFLRGGNKNHATDPSVLQQRKAWQGSWQTYPTKSVGSGFRVLQSITPERVATQEFKPGTTAQVTYNYTARATNFTTNNYQDTVTLTFVYDGGDKVKVSRVSY